MAEYDDNDEPTGGPQKVSQKTANYRTAGDGGPSCASCANFFEPTMCRLVESPVSAAGICDLFAPKQNEQMIANQVFMPGGQQGGEAGG